MRRNVTNFERILRVATGLGFAAIAFGLSIPWLAFLALIPIGTGITGYCPMYQWIGFNDHSDEATR